MSVRDIRVIKKEMEGRNPYIKRVAAYCRVSTDNEEQLLSYESQIKYYKQKIEANPEWILTNIYADRGIGGMTDNRRAFQDMIESALEGNMDIIITKSISRFARNTLDTLKYVRKLKEAGVAVIFEKENINTLVDGEYFLVILSSIAQQESESLSSNVTMGLKMKMKRGDYPFRKCYGYKYDVHSKEISIDEAEAKVVKEIFQLYLKGLGTHKIAKRMTEAGHLTPTGNQRWDKSTIHNILRNEKYKGDILLQKTFTYNVIERRRKKNIGQKEKYYIKDNHLPIIDADTWNQVQEAMKGRTKEAIRNAYPIYVFTRKIQCDFCGTNYIRKIVRGQVWWGCYKKFEQGKNSCLNKTVKESFIKERFLLAYNNTVKNKKELLSSVTYESYQESIMVLEKKMLALIDLKIEGTIQTDHYVEKYDELLQQKKSLLEKSKTGSEKNYIETHFNKGFTNMISSFEEELFLEIVEKVKIKVKEKDEDEEYIEMRFYLKYPYKKVIEYME